MSSWCFLTTYPIVSQQTYNSSYPTQRSGNDGGYSSPRRQNPYAQQDDNPSYEMADVNPSTAHLTTNMVADTMSSFYDEVRVKKEESSIVLTGQLICIDFVRPGERQTFQ